MSVSTEALAMAGVDYMEWGMDVEEWERDDELPPPHLLADRDVEEEEEKEFMQRQLEQNISCNNKPEDDSGSGRMMVKLDIQKCFNGEEESAVFFFPFLF